MILAPPNTEMLRTQESPVTTLEETHRGLDRVKGEIGLLVDHCISEIPW